MALTKVKQNQLALSTNPGSIIASDSSNIFNIVSSSPGADHLFFYDHSALAVVPLTVGTNLSITGTTINASAGAGGYTEIQEEGSALTARSKFNFIGAGITAADDAGNVRTNITLNSFLNTLATQGNVDLTGSQVTGALPATKGGTGQSTTAVGDLLVGAASNTFNKLTIGANGTLLKSNGTTASWGTISTTDLSDNSNVAKLNGTHTISGTYTFSNNITINGTPSANTDAATVGYVLTAIAGLRKGSVRGATTTTLTATAQTSTTITLGGTSFTHDGITYANNDTILVKNSVTGGSGGTFNNGVYSVGGVGTSIVLTRVTWMDAANEIDGVYVLVEDGTTNASTLWMTVSEVTTLGTDAITFTQIPTTGDGTVSSVAATAPAAGITISGSPITTTGTLTFALANDLAAVEGLSANGMAARTATDTWAVRTITGTTNRITLTNGDGVSGNPTIDISASYVGQATITTLGTISTGIWNGTAVGSIYGGTGQTTVAVGDILIGTGSNTWGKLTIGSNGTALKSNGTTASWQASITRTVAYLTGSTSSTIDLDSGTAVTDVDGNNITFTVPTDLDLVTVVRNGIVLARSGTVSRDYTLVSATGILTLSTALTTDETLMVYKLG